MTDPQDLDLWAHKPIWCKPWSILLTGDFTMLSSWLLVHRLWITVAVSALVLIWWWVFLVLAPAAYRNSAPLSGSKLLLLIDQFCLQLFY